MNPEHPDSKPTEADIRNALRIVIDPEAGMNIVDLGLVYGIAVEERSVKIDLTMTSPACPMGEMMMDEIRRTLQTVFPGGIDVAVNLVWDPPWNPSMMSAEAKQRFGW